MMPVPRIRRVEPVCPKSPLLPIPQLRRVDPMAKVILSFLFFGVIAVIPACIVEISRQPDNPHKQTILRVQISESLDRIGKERLNQEDPHTMP
jgi:hypothetical protein